jgi:hypothetical protein
LLTINVLHRRRWGRTDVLSGAEAARRSHLRLACRQHHPSLRLQTTAVDSAWIFCVPEPGRPKTCVISGPALYLPAKPSATSPSRVLLSDQRLIRTPPPRHGAHAAQLPRPAQHAAPRLGWRNHDERHPRVRSNVRLTLWSYVPLFDPPERCDAVSLYSVQP